MFNVAVCPTHTALHPAGKLIDGRAISPLENVLIVIEGDTDRLVVQEGSAPAGGTD